MVWLLTRRNHITQVSNQLFNRLSRDFKNFQVLNVSKFQYFKVEQKVISNLGASATFFFQVTQTLVQSGAGTQLFQSWAKLFSKWGSYLKVGENIISKWGNYLKVGITVSLY